MDVSVRMRLKIFCARSRDHYCVNPKVESLSGSAKNAACKRLLQEPTGCRFNQGKSRV